MNNIFSLYIGGDYHHPKRNQEINRVLYITKVIEATRKLGQIVEIRDENLARKL